MKTEMFYFKKDYLANQFSHSSIKNNFSFEQMKNDFLGILKGNSLRKILSGIPHYFLLLLFFEKLPFMTI